MKKQKERREKCLEGNAGFILKIQRQGKYWLLEKDLKMSVRETYKLEVIFQNKEDLLVRQGSRKSS